MSNSTLQAVTQPDTGATDPLHELLRKGELLSNPVYGRSGGSPV